MIFFVISQVPTALRFFCPLFLFFAYPYDWRQPMAVQADLLKNFLVKITENSYPKPKINIISHSLGGLVIRSFLDKYPNLFEFSQVLTLGTPHRGTPAVYELWSGGEIKLNDNYLKIAARILSNYCRQKLGTTSFAQTLHLVVPSLKNLLPVDPFLRNESGDLIPVAQMTNQNDWLLSSPRTNQITTIAGNDVSTLQTIKVASPSAEEAQNGQWIDGKPTELEKVNQGDGTILLKSALLPTSIGSEILSNTDHSAIVNSDLGIATVLKKLGLENLPLAKAKREGSLNIKSIPINLDLLNKKFEWKRYKLNR